MNSRRVALLALLLGCSRAPEDGSPEGAVSLWLERAEDGRDDAESAKARYQLLGPAARDNLEERADRASKSLGKRVEPFEMLAVGAGGVRFHPRSIHAETKGESALVTVMGSGPNEVARIQTVRTREGWRIEPDLPPTPIQAKRDGG